ncbi:TRAUB-domain-containing protein [Sistotremastrum niveocremeum HHB9708]|uniref:Protein BFR2 n=1 Tax=Sistotremastrum niveocremeum HHB9708 TaxID=1314777 RepID=A0A164VR45_9AGAM|nr:TRAUB-domain-containing protein [Sistotremastrum niveocremeum HHB9708]
MSKPSLLQQIAELENSAPAEADPENSYGVAERVGRDGGEGEQNVGREHYVEVDTSTLRKGLDIVSDPKYEGVRVSRKDIMEDHGDESGDGAQDEEDEDEVPTSSDEEEPEEEIAQHEDEEADSGADNITKVQFSTSTEENGRVGPVRLSSTAENIATPTASGREPDIVKGKAISRQLTIWNSLLDARIKIQKAISLCNTLPEPSELDTHLSRTEAQDPLRRLLDETLLLSEDLFDLQERVLNSNESIELPPRKRRRLDTDDSNPDWEEILTESMQDWTALEVCSHPHLIRTLHKWSTKVNSVAPSALLPSSRNAFRSNASTQLRGVAEVLRDDRTVAKSRVPRGEVRRIGHAEDPLDPGSVELDGFFEDGDFYQQMLRDVIDSKGGLSGGSTDINDRPKKIKKKVDTKASKGRKLRYDVHEKLQHFMVPVPNATGWHDEQIDELFSSLLGRTEEAVSKADGLNPLKDGFRLFG